MVLRWCLTYKDSVAAVQENNVPQSNIWVGVWNDSELYSFLQKDVLTQYHPTCIWNCFPRPVFSSCFPWAVRRNDSICGNTDVGMSRVFPCSWSIQVESVENSGLVTDRLHYLEIPVSHCLGWVTAMIQFSSLWFSWCRASGSGAGQDKWEEVGSGWEIKVKHSGEGRRAGNFLSLLIEPKYNYIVVEILCWFQVPLSSMMDYAVKIWEDIWNCFFFPSYLGHARAVYLGWCCFYLKHPANGTVNIWAAGEESAFLLGWRHRKKESARLVRVSVWYPERCIL